MSKDLIKKRSILILWKKVCPWKAKKSKISSPKVIELKKNSRIETGWLRHKMGVEKNCQNILFIYFFNINLILSDTNDIF